MKKALIISTIILVGGLGILAAAGGLLFVLISSLHTKEFATVDMDAVITVERAGTRVEAVITAIDGTLPSELVVEDREYDPKFYNASGAPDRAEYGVRADRTQISVERVDDYQAKVSYLVGVRENGHRAVVLSSPLDRTGPRQIQAQVNGTVESCLKPAEFDINDRSYVWARSCEGGPAYIADEVQDGELSLPVWLRLSLND